MAPATLVLEGQLVVHSLEGTRTVPSKAFFTGPGQSALRDDELLTWLYYPIPPTGSAGCYLKLGRNKAGDLALVSVAVLGYPDRSAPSGVRFRIALGSVAPVPLRAHEAESLLAEQVEETDRLRLAAERAAEAASPIDDVRASAAYRAAMVRNLTLRGLREVWQQLHTEPRRAT
jgi:carbon-monoxide dehydrogenase medium subunit